MQAFVLPKPGGNHTRWPPDDLLATAQERLHTLAKELGELSAKDLPLIRSRLLRPEWEARGKEARLEETLALDQGGGPIGKRQGSPRL